MSDINVEIKARRPDPERIRAILRSRDTEFKGTDHQIDTYFKVPAGRLKLREGNIENALIFYSRPDQAGPKEAEVSLCRLKTCGISKEELACESWTRNCKAGIIPKAEAAPMEQWAWQIPSRSFEFCPADVRIYY